MSVQDDKGVFVFAQQVDNKITSVSYELIGKGKELANDLGTEVTAVLLGHNVEPLCERLAKYGADKIIVVGDPAAVAGMVGNNRQTRRYSGLRARLAEE